MDIDEETKYIAKRIKFHFSRYLKAVHESGALLTDSMEKSFMKRALNAAMRDYDEYYSGWKTWI